MDKLKELAAKIREKIVAIASLTLIAVGSMIFIKDPENIVVNVIIAIGALTTTGGTRKSDKER